MEFNLLDWSHWLDWFEKQGSRGKTGDRGRRNRSQKSELKTQGERMNDRGRKKARGESLRSRLDCS